MHRRSPYKNEPMKPTTPVLSLSGRNEQFLRSLFNYSRLPQNLQQNIEAGAGSQPTEPPAIVLPDEKRKVRKIISFLDNAVAPSLPTTPRVSITTPFSNQMREMSSTSDEQTPIDRSLYTPIEDRSNRVFVAPDRFTPLTPGLPPAAAPRSHRPSRSSLSKVLSSASLVESVGSTHTVVVPSQKRRYHPIFRPDKESLLFDQINQLAGTDYSIRTDKGFIWFTRKNSNADTNPVDAKGVKFHVSLSHIEEKYIRGVLIVLEELLRFNHPHFKIVQPSFLSKEVYDEPGREVTIYAYMEKNIIENGRFCSSYSNLLRTILKRLNKAQIPPYIDLSDRVIPPVKDTLIPELLRISWRNDRCGYLSINAPNHSIIELSQENEDETTPSLSFTS